MGPNLKTFKLFFLLLAAKSWGAMVPDSVAGNVIYFSAPVMHGHYTHAIALGANGVATGLFQDFYLYPGPEENRNPPAGGSYSYRKLNDVAAELIISGEKYKLNLNPADGDVVGTALSENGNSYGFRLARLPAASMINCSNRSFVRAGGSAFVGFVMSDQNRFVLIRAVGPGLAQFGLTGLLATPRLKVTLNSSNLPFATNQGWPSDSAESIRNTGAVVGAFPLQSASADSAVIVKVGAAAYVVEVSSANPSDSGEVLIEVYVLP